MKSILPTTAKQKITTWIGFGELLFKAGAKYGNKCGQVMAHTSARMHHSDRCQIYLIMPDTSSGNIVATFRENRATLQPGLRKT